MIDEFYYDELAETMVELWSEIESELIEEIARRIKKSLRITSTAEFELTKLQQANLLNKRAVEIISKKADISQKELERLIRQSGFSIVRQDEAIYRLAIESGQLTLDPLPIDMSPSLQTAIQSCVANAEFGLSNLTNTRMIDAGNGMETLTKAARREYYNAVNKAFLEVRTGAKSTPQALRSACMELAQRGISITHWESGHTDRVEVAVRRNVKTSLAQTAAKMTLARMSDYQHDLVEVSSHFGARPSHFIWQGKVYSLTGSEGYENFYEATGYGTGAGLCGWNCRHRFYPYFPGIQRVYPEYDEEANRIHYENTQKQRAYERAVRAAKHEKAALMGAGAGEAEINAANAKIRAKQKALRDYLSAHPELARDYSREQVYNKSGAVKHYGTGLDKSGRSDIIDSKIQAFKADIANGKVNTTLDTKNQPKHMLNKIWKNQVNQAVQNIKARKKATPRSLLAKGLDPQSIIKEYAGKGDYYEFRDKNKYPDEFITLPFEVGRTYNKKTGKYEATDRVQIKYDENKGAHVFPVLRKEINL